MKIKVECQYCGNKYLLDISEDQYNKLVEGKELIQNIIPEVDPGIREIFISGVCPDCWDKTFG